MRSRLTDFQEAFILGAFPMGTRIVGASYLNELTPCPMRVDLATGTHRHSAVLRLSRFEHGVEREAEILPVLRALGLEVPEIMCGPVIDLANPDQSAMTLMPLMPGLPLNRFAEAGPASLNRAGDLLIIGVKRLEELTDEVRATSTGSRLPARTLYDDYVWVAERAGDWFAFPAVRHAVSLLRDYVAFDRTPLVMSNGDADPANFIADETGLTGYLDFERACFEDPLIRWAHFPVDEFRPLSASDVLERYLALTGHSAEEFAVRVAIVALRRLITRVPIDGGDPHANQKRTHILRVLESAVATFQTAA